MAKRQKSPPSESDFTPLVERDFTALARAGALSPSWGLEESVAEVASLLGQGGKSPLLAGEMGVGKSAIVQELARKAHAGALGPSLEKVRILEVTAAGVFSRTGSPKAAAELFEGLVEHFAAQGPVLFFLRDVALVPGSSLLPVLIRALRLGRARFIFECELTRAHALLKSDEAFAERLHLVVVNEPTPERARWILSRLAESLESELLVAVDPSACDVALRLSVKFLLARRLPRKAIELLKETAAEAAGSNRERITGEDVLARFCATTRLPRFMADDAVPLDLAEVERFFGARLLGQSDAVQAVLRSVALLKAGLNNPRRPLGVFLFSGPTGVGKTHLAKLLAEYLFGSPDRLVRLNMADYPEPGDEAVLFGNSWAQTHEGKRGELTRQLEGKVFTVLLLDEFEKAHEKCHDRFLQLFDEGQFINAAGEAVPCSNTLIVATSNVGAEVYTSAAVGFAARRSDDELLADIDRRIAATFRPEFLNRFDALCHFRPLGKVEIRRIAQREVGRVLERDGIRARSLDVEVAPEVVDLLVERGYSPAHGARYLQREIEKTLTAALAVEIARAALPPGTPVKVVAHKGRVHAIAEPKVRREKEAVAQAQLPAAGAAFAKKKLDRGALVLEAERLFVSAAAVAARAGHVKLETRKRELLAASQSPGFWDDGEKAARDLREFRQVESHLAELERLREVCGVAKRRAREARSELQLGHAVRALEEAAREVHLAEARLLASAGGNADEAWLDVSAQGAGAESWVRELVGLYLGWAERRGFEARVEAEGDEPCRAVLRLSGPGVQGFLSAERGAHRRIDDDARAVAYVRPLVPSASAEAPALTRREVKRRAGRFVERVGQELTAVSEGSGRAVSLALHPDAKNGAALAAMLLSSEGDSLDEARRYFVGRSARVEDPRTGEGTPRVKEVLRGEIDGFIAAWMARPPPQG
ncbi:MAG: AAA family ATPase [Myxococcaceae bacterium]|nr:AAA family ATPase [Myxococcaceae bacterium]